MLEAPAISIASLIECVRRDYGVPASKITFLPLGADVNTAVFCVNAGESRYFLKLRSGAFDETSVLLPAFLHQQGNAHVIPIVPAANGALWSRFQDYAVILYPFVEGRDGFGVKLNAAQWHAFGAAFRQIHSVQVPASILGRIPVERYSPAGREAVLATLANLDGVDTSDAITRSLVNLLREQHDKIVDLVARAGRLARLLQAQSPALVVCHSDIHAGNILVDDAGHVFIVDWDNPIQAPKERDLMYFGGGQGFVGYTPQEEIALFFAGYGNVEINQTAMSYYRYERIVQDIAAFCESLLSSEGDGEDRRQSFKWLKSNFDDGGVIDQSHASDQSVM